MSAPSTHPAPCGAMTSSGWLHPSTRGQVPLPAASPHTALTLFGLLVAVPTSVVALGYHITLPRSFPYLSPHLCT